MSKKTIWALVIIAILAVILVLNGGKTISLNILFTRINVIQSIAFLVFSAVGVVVGLLLK